MAYEFWRIPSASHSADALTPSPTPMENVQHTSPVRQAPDPETNDHEFVRDLLSRYRHARGPSVEQAAKGLKIWESIVNRLK